MAQPSARDRILDTAKKLFYRDGLRATGVDRIVAESGVAKMSLYRHFPSKHHLVSAFLAWRHAYWMARFVASVEARFAQHAALSVLADAMDEWFADADFRGCAFINAVAETGATEESHHVDLAIAHKAGLERYIVELARRLDLRAPELVAQEAMLCLEGMIVRTQMKRDPGIVAAGRRVLARIEQDAKSGLT
jgi:AcrR family transcriptional regulator